MKNNRYSVAVLTAALLTASQISVYAETPVTSIPAPGQNQPGQPAATSQQSTQPAITPATTTSNPDALQGQVQQNQNSIPASAQNAATPNTAAQAPTVQSLIEQIIGVTKTPVALQGELAKNYAGMQITLKNDHPYHISVLEGSVMNAVDENTALSQIYQEQYSKAARRQRGSAIFGGLLSTAASFVPYAGGVAGYATSSALGAASNVVGAVGYAGGPDGYPAASGQFVRQIKEVIISPGEVYQFATLMPKGMTPQLKLIIKNLQSNDIVTIQR